METETGAMNPMAKPQMLGELKLSAEVKATLLLKTGGNGLPDARDLSLDELWRSQIQNGSNGESLQQFIVNAKHPEKPNLQPDWNNYREVEQNCRKLKIVMRDLGFNKFDRNAVLYYFLAQTPEWKSYNVTGQEILSGDARLGPLQQARAKNFGACLTQDDFESMKTMGLAVNSDRDWSAALQQVQEKESYLGNIQALERQLVSVLKTPNAADMERQAFPLITTKQNGNGTVLLQNNLGSFGLEQMLNLQAMPGDGAIVNAGQLAQVFTNLKIADVSCARPAFEQGRPVPNVAILLFATQSESPLSKGAALEFEFNAGKIVRLSIQNTALRDFRQGVISHPEIGDCKIEHSWIERL
jgi:hypothetical protein